MVIEKNDCWRTFYGVLAERENRFSEMPALKIYRDLTVKNPGITNENILGHKLIS